MNRAPFLTFAATVVRILVFGGAMLLTGAGCHIGPNQPFPAKDRFGLEATGVSATSPGTETGSVKVELVRVAPPYDQRGFVYRTGELAYANDYYNQFIADPNELLTSAILRGLARSGMFAAVLDGATAVESPMRLEITVTRLEGDYRISDQPRAVIAMRAALVEDADGRFRLVDQTVIEHSEPLQGVSPADLCQGWGVALGRCVSQLAEWSHRNVAPTTRRTAGADLAPPVPASGSLAARR